MLKLSPDGAEFIAGWEGFRPTVYRCSAGYETIGIGHRVQPGENWTRISEGDALDLLMSDAIREAAPVAARLLHPLKPYQADALISLAFNAGGYRIAGSTLLRRINENRISDAANEFLKWDKETVRGVKRVNRGLAKRRAAEHRLFLYADYSGRP